MACGVAQPEARLAGAPLDAGAFQEVERCALCGGAAQRPRFAEGGFRVVACGDCGLVYVTPRLRPERLPEVYDADYWRSAAPSRRGYADYAAEGPLYRRTFARRLRRLARHLGPPGRVLDVGCAAGFFLEVMRDRGWEVAGVEPSAAIAGAARERVGAERIHAGTLETAPFDAGRFDLVTLWDVVEHVADPVDLLRRAARLLAPEGLLVLETQDVGSPVARALGRRWHHFKHLEHLYHFDRRTVEALLRRAGLAPVEITADAAGKEISFGFLRERATRLHPAVAGALRPLRALDGVSAYVNPRDEMIVVARRQGAA